MVQAAEDLQDEVWLNCVGTFGVGSAGYWWSRGGAALLRVSHYCAGPSNALWALLYADDGWATLAFRHTFVSELTSASAVSRIPFNIG